MVHASKLSGIQRLMYHTIVDVLNIVWCIIHQLDPRLLPCNYDGSWSDPDPTGINLIINDNGIWWCDACWLHWVMTLSLLGNVNGVWVWTIAILLERTIEYLLDSLLYKFGDESHWYIKYSCAIKLCFVTCQIIAWIRIVTLLKIVEPWVDGHVTHQLVNYEPCIKPPNTKTQSCTMM